VNYMVTFHELKAAAAVNSKNFRLGTQERLTFRAKNEFEAFKLMSCETLVDNTYSVLISTRYYEFSYTVSLHRRRFGEVKRSLFVQ
jgi:hypothetical protein